MHWHRKLAFLHSQSRTSLRCNSTLRSAGAGGLEGSQSCAEQKRRTSRRELPGQSDSRFQGYGAECRRSAALLIARAASSPWFHDRGVFTAAFRGKWCSDAQQLRNPDFLHLSRGDEELCGKERPPLFPCQAERQVAEITGAWRPMAAAERVCALGRCQQRAAC